jgi:hypothetical protein
MKKALVVLLILAAAGGLFAQGLSKEITVDYVVDLFYLSSEHKGAEQKNLLTSNAFDDTELRLKVWYKSEYFTAYIRLNADSLIRRNQSVAAPTAGAGSFSAGNARPIDLLYKTFGEYGLTATGGMWKAYFGNEAHRGLVDRFQNFDDFLTLKHDNYGITALTDISTTTVTTGSKPYMTATKTSDAWDVNNFAQKAPHGYITAPWLGVWADFKDIVPITIGVAGSLNDGNGATKNPAFGEYQRANGAIRISGDKLADLVTFDAIYKYYSWDTPTIDTGGSAHTFGLYANLFVVDPLGIGIGYSGSVKTSDDNVAGDAVKYPFYSGIDLRFKYTFDPFTFTLNNNISFASVKGSDDDIVNGVAGNPLGKKESGGYFALYNALGVAYKLSDTLALQFQLGNELIKYSYENTTTGIDVTEDITFDTLQTAIFAAYTVNANFSFRFGLDLRNTFIKTAREAGTIDFETYKYGRLEFGIPVGIKVVF